MSHRIPTSVLTIAWWFVLVLLSVTVGTIASASRRAPRQSVTETADVLCYDNDGDLAAAVNVRWDKGCKGGRFDANKDKQVTATDALAVLRIATGLGCD